MKLTNHLFVRKRNKKGSMLALVTAVTLGIVLAIIFFALNYTRLLGGFGEQKTAIEAAALTAAQDLSRIVIASDTMGYVSLSDYIPQSTNASSLNVAKDNLPLSVKGLNTLIGTARLDMIIANRLNNKVMAGLANYDLMCITNDVIPKLNSVMQDAVLPSPKGTYVDVNNKAITAYSDAQNAYTSNSIRMTGKTSYQPGSLKLELGYNGTPTITNIQVPTPASYAPQPNGGAPTSSNGYYLSNVHIPFTSNLVPGGPVDYMFAGIGSSVSLIDSKNFQLVAAATVTPQTQFPLKFQATMMPTIVRATASQTFYNNQAGNQTITASACAQPGGSVDPDPKPGALSVAFTDGPIAAFNSLNDILTNNSLNNIGTTCETAVGGDYSNGTSGGALLNDTYIGITEPSWWSDTDVWPLANVQSNPSDTTPQIADACALAVYDWYRQGGTRVNVDSVFNVVNSSKYTQAVGKHNWKVVNNLGQQQDITKGSTSGSPKPQEQISLGVSYYYKLTMNTDGSLSATMLTETPSSPMPYMSLAENQFFAYTLNAYSPGGQTITWNPVQNLHFKGGDKILSWIAGILPSPLSKTSTGTEIDLLPVWDVAVRSQVRNRGTGAGASLGGTHGGTPIPNPDVNVTSHLQTRSAKTLVAQSNNSKRDSNGVISGFADGIECGGKGIGAKKNQPPGGTGAHPIIGTESDFDDHIPAPETVFPAQYPNYITYSLPYQKPFPSQTTTGGIMRPTYQMNGSVCQIRFRQQLQAKVTGTETSTSVLTSTLTTATSTVSSSTSSASSSIGYFEEEQ